ncbi:DoxX family protein [Neptunicoccus cionae]|uniref:DoxX family protein n=1 Tax=Neptunicoccus cionae TaxID=2035344 RepID=UPI000C760D97|nr:DoxX family protein [Amylibacter cionae]PLS22571.1 DoxX family protein [Amylibacter cionae]
MQKYIVWGLSALVSFFMLMGGYGKLSGAPEMHGAFQMMGLPGWFGYFIGACELAAAIGIWLPRLQALAALGVAIIMIGAVYFHVVYTPIQTGIPAFVVLISCAVIFQYRRKEAIWA